MCGLKKKVRALILTHIDCPSPRTNYFADSRKLFVLRICADSRKFADKYKSGFRMVGLVMFRKRIRARTLAVNVRKNQCADFFFKSAHSCN